MLCRAKDLKKYLQIYFQILQQSKNVKAKKYFSNGSCEESFHWKLRKSFRWKLYGDFEGVCIYSWLCV